ncbi:hypothetical protein GQ53DRAFT_743523 [Thozetella sp. PMI_491]|nr:hypothetical protein GQ53DRAFT_743523 [Thozetella sp. PMI_491]
MSSPNPQIVEKLKQLYHTYRHTPSIDAKGLFFSPACSQICRPAPSWAATDRATIVRYLHETAADREAIFRYLGQPAAPETGSGGGADTKNYYTIRPLASAEWEFETDDITSAIGLTSAQLKEKAQREQWVGMRVDIWGDEGHVDGKLQGLAIKVHYWWRQEGEEWLQILHDILYIGPRDGTEGAGAELRE